MFTSKQNLVSVSLDRLFKAVAQATVSCAPQCNHLLEVSPGCSHIAFIADCTMRLFLLLAILASCQAASLFIIDDQDLQVKEHVDRIKRYSDEEIHGHTIGVLHAEDPDSGIVHGLTKRDVLNHVAHPASGHRQFSLELQTGERVHMALARRNVVTASTNIIERGEDGSEVYHPVPHNCLFAGPTRNTVGHAAISLCDGELMGSVNAEKRHYEIHELPPEVAERHRRSTDLMHVLVTWSDFDDSHKLHDSNRRSVGDTDDGYEEKDYDDTLNIDSSKRVRRSTDDIYSSDYVRTNQRVDRDPHSKVAIIESAAYLDEDFHNRLVLRYGFSNFSQVVRVALLKYCGMASVYSDPKFGWNITIRLVHLEVFKKNPEWYLKESERANARMGQRMGIICRSNRHVPFDQITVWTTNCTHKNFIGYTFLGGACSKTHKCIVTIDASLRYSVELHELGHSLGLWHEWTLKPCQNKTDHAGFMGGLVSYAPKCYQADFDRLLPKRKCLFWEAFTTAGDENITTLTPGMKLGFDGQCKYLHGDEFRYLHAPENPICWHFYCIGSDPNKPTFQTIKRSRAVSGTPCAHERLCTFKTCPPLNETSYSRVVKSHKMVDGRWGPWSDYSPCNDAKGMTSLKVATRQCNNPEPHYGAYCVGDSNKAEVCNVFTPRSGESELEMATRRICKYYHDNAPAGSESTHYRTFNGFLRETTGIVDTCSIQCQRSDRRKASNTVYVLPDGVPCAGLGPGADDKIKGITRRCVHGVCMAFGCNGKSIGEGGGLVYDACGVCGGSGDTCLHGEFNGLLKKGDRGIVVVLPVGATNIYIGHPRSDQEEADIEIWTKDKANEQPVLSKAYRKGMTDLNHPTNYANTYWYFDDDSQSVTAAGPIDVPVIVKMRGGGFEEFHRAYYHYTQPTDDYLKPVNCTNGGTPFAGGCQCPKGFYGSRCEHTCRTICRGGASLDLNSCTCQCNFHQTGEECLCKDDYIGESCSQCKVQCKNGGTLNVDTCKCSCPVNCDGPDCSEQCRNRKGHCPWSGRCWKNEVYKQRCRQKCDLCKRDYNINGGQCKRVN